MWGSDQAASLEPDGMRRLVSYIRNLNSLESNQKKHILEKEIPIMSKLRTVDDL
jgi:N-acetylneuraminate synthase